MTFEEWINTKSGDIARDMLELNNGLDVLLVSIQDAMEHAWREALKNNKVEE